MPDSQISLGNMMNPPEKMAVFIRDFLASGFVNIIGGVLRNHTRAYPSLC
jgi:methionine synthase I (cobalamin-dependent)